MTDEQATEMLALLKDIRSRLEAAVPRCDLCNIQPRQNHTPYCLDCEGRKIMADLERMGYNIR